MYETVEEFVPEVTLDVDLEPRGKVYPSPRTWRDQVLYFLLPDRFSDGLESRRPIFDRKNPHSRAVVDKHTWMKSGKRFQGGTVRGIKDKLPYLENLGVTAIWIGPVWHQRKDLETYHGYGIQNFTDVDPRFGTRKDLRDLVSAAHNRDMYVILDIIYNHTGNNWFYEKGDGSPAETLPYRFAPPYPVHGWRSGDGHVTDHIETHDDGVWPSDFQNKEWYTRSGKIGRWDTESWEDQRHPDNEFRRGDFFDLKDLNLSRNDTLSAIIRVYQYWIALTDCDGFRIDTVKHIPWVASRHFCGAIHEYAELIGKDNFLLLGEVTGGADIARDYLEVFGRNIDAVLDIGSPSNNLLKMVKGFSDPYIFFSQFGGHDSLGSHRESGRYHVSILDDHDMVGKSGKHRFAANNDISNRYDQVASAVGVQLTTLGIPCIYYGTEQAFDGTENRHDQSVKDDKGFEDRYIRECMFGGMFGAFETENCHFFDINHPTYLRISAISKVRNQRNKVGLALRRGRQYLRETSICDEPFSIPGKGELVAWSRIMLDQEVLIALNTNGVEWRGAKVAVDKQLHLKHFNGDSPHMTYVYKSSWEDDQLRIPLLNEDVPIENSIEDRSYVRIELPPAGMVILT